MRKLLLGLVLFSGPVFAQTPSPSPTPEPCFNCQSARIKASAALVWNSSDATQTQSSVLGTLSAETPVVFGKTTVGRAGISFSFLTIPGAATPSPANFNSLEGEAWGKYFVSKNFGFMVSAWVNQKVNAATAVPSPAAPSTWGYGVGVVGHGAGSHASILVGQDNYAGDLGGVQIRVRAKLAVPQTSVKGSPPIGSLYVDARLSLTSAPAVLNTSPVPTGTAPSTLNSSILYGIMIDADSIWSAIFPPVSSPAAPVKSSDSRYGPVPSLTEHRAAPLCGRS
jgi:hypothetical protein